jgi:hypothetical protein
MNPFFDRLADLMRAEAGEAARSVEPPPLTGEMARALLDLTRVVAHTEERRFGPLSAYVVGSYLERLRASGAALDDAAAAALVDRVAAALDEPA